MTADAAYLSGMSFGPGPGLAVFDRALDGDTAADDGNEDATGIQQRILV
ncbi:hypothetical protein [Rhizobium sp. RCC_161_2]